MKVSQPPKIGLHKDFLGTKVEKFIRSDEYSEAVRVAFLRVNNRVKNITGLSIDGASLMRTAFSPNSPFIKVNNLQSQEDLDEQEGLMYFFVGGVLAFRNPPSHDDEKSFSRESMISALSIANYLMSVLDRYSIKN